MNIGDKAPEILGKDENGKEIRLSDFQGEKSMYGKQKISGTFRSDVGADAFFTIHTFHCRYSMEEQPITT